jgi:DNA-binding beta-propeller fold protein YncE
MISGTAVVVTGVEVVVAVAEREALIPTRDGQRKSPPATDDPGNHRVLKLPAGSNTPSVLPFTGPLSPWGVAVDSAGNLYVTDQGNNRVVKLVAG